MGLYHDGGPSPYNPRTTDLAYTGHGDWGPVSLLPAYKHNVLHSGSFTVALFQTFASGLCQGGRWISSHCVLLDVCT
jgi:hypothetical protein